jgi:serine/threonine protein kinase
VLTTGSTLDGRYEILGLLASGGMGEVYRTRRVLLGDEVAIKVIRTAGDDAGDLRERFLRESRLCAQLRHPNIVTILDFAIAPDGQPYLVMEHLNGPSLREELAAHGPMSPEDVQRVVEPICAALQLAHAVRSGQQVQVVVAEQAVRSAFERHEPAQHLERIGSAVHQVAHHHQVVA